MLKRLLDEQVVVSGFIILGRVPVLTGDIKHKS